MPAITTKLPAGVEALCTEESKAGSRRRAQGPPAIHQLAATMRWLPLLLRVKHTHQQCNSRNSRCNSNSQWPACFT